MRYHKRITLIESHGKNVIDSNILITHVPASPQALYRQCSEQDKIDLFCILLENDIDIHTPLDKRTASPLLIREICNHNYLSARLFLSFGADINYYDSDYRMTPLSLCIEGNQLDILKLLLDNGVDINKKVNGKTPIQIAIEHQHWEIVNILLHETVNILLYNKNLTENNKILTKNNILSAFKLICNQHGPNFEFAGQRLIFHAIKTGWFSSVYTLYDSKIFVDKKTADIKGRTPFLYAIECGFFAMANIFKCSNTTINTPDNEGRTPLHHAALLGHTCSLKYLLKLDVNVKSKDNEGNTALHLAASQGDIFSVCQLLNHYDDTNYSLNDAGQSPINLSIEQGFVRVEDMLIKHVHLKKKYNRNFLGLKHYFPDNPMYRAEKGERWENFINE